MKSREKVELYGPVDDVLVRSRWSIKPQCCHSKRAIFGFGLYLEISCREFGYYELFSYGQTTSTCVFDISVSTLDYKEGSLRINYNKLNWTFSKDRAVNDCHFIVYCKIDTSKNMGCWLASHVGEFYYILDSLKLIEK